MIGLVVPVGTDQLNYIGYPLLTVQMDSVVTCLELLERDHDPRWCTVSTVLKLLSSPSSVCAARRKNCSIKN